MEISSIHCYKCKADITCNMKFYDSYMNCYCYDCWEKHKQVLKAEKEPVQFDKVSIRKMYKAGLKPSEIAAKIGCTVIEVYDVLIERIK